MKPAWPTIEDEAFVERLLPALQEAIAACAVDRTNNAGWTELPAGDVVNALLILLASVLEASPAAATAPGMRQMAEAAGNELHLLMKDARQLSQAAAVDPGGVQ